MSPEQVKLILTLRVHVHFRLFNKYKRVLVANKELYFYADATIFQMRQVIADEIDNLRNDADLVDIWDRTEVSVTKCYFNISGNLSC